MEKIWNYILCYWIVGHDFDEDHCRSIGFLVCERCGYEGCEDDSDSLVNCILTVYWTLWFNVVPPLKRFREWITCTQCGRHFGRHDNNVDHCPF